MYLTALILLLTATTAGAEDLESRLAAYWNHLAQRDKASAMEFVTPETRNHFINRREPTILSWQLLGTEPLSDSEVLVRVQVQRKIPGMPGVFPIEVAERWVHQDQWEVAIAPPDPILIPGEEQPGHPAAAAGRISSNPEVLKIPFLNPRRLGAVYLSNGLADELRVSKIEFDRARFRLVEAPTVIASGESARLKLEFTGQEVAKNLASDLRVTLEGGDREVRTLEIPVTYNYFSEGARGLFGLTAEEADQVRPGEKLEPAISTPAVREAIEKARRQPSPTQTPRPPDSEQERAGSSF